jgi:hypothetical protein
MWSSILKYFIKDNLIPEADAQVVSSSASLPAPVVAETEEQTLEREQNDRNVLSDALGEYECDAGMSVEDLPAIVKIKLMKTLKWRLIAHQFNTVCAVGMVKSVETKEECCWPVCGQV